MISFEAFNKKLDNIIKRQQQKLLELSTPVVKIWVGIIIPLIDTLDSARTQIVLEN